MNSNIPNNQTRQKLSKKLKNLFTLTLFTAAMISLAPATALGNNHPPAPDLFDDYDIQQATSKVLPAKAVKGKNRSVNVHTDLLWSDTLTLNLFDDVVVTAVRDRMIDNVKGGSSWIGHIEGDDNSEVFLSIRGQVMSGVIQTGSNVYEISYTGNKIHEINQLDLSKNPPDHPNGQRTVENEQDSLQTPLELNNAAYDLTGTGTIIDVMVVYTAAARNNAGGQSGMQAKIDNAIAMANQAYVMVN